MTQNTDAPIRFTINGRELSASPGETVLQAAKRNGIEIPALCNHPDLPPSGTCGLCIVEIGGQDEPQRSCLTAVSEGMSVTTESEDLTNRRRIAIQKILDRHALECPDCVFFQKCELLRLSGKLQGKPTTVPEPGTEVIRCGPIVFDQTKCIGCGNCVAACPTGFLEIGADGRVKPTDDPTRDCTGCGQCIMHCPVGAIESVGEFEDIDGILDDSGKVNVVQFAPAVRSAIGEEFGLPPGSVMTGQVTAALKAIGFSHVFDTAAAADITTIEEAEELLGRLSSGQRLPGMTSCCPAWVKFVEFNYPEFVPNLCTARSPQIMLGGVIKSVWGKSRGIDPHRINMVSVMPCTAKKHEVTRPELAIDGWYPVDRVITVRELARLMKKRKLDLTKIDPMEPDDPFGIPSGAGVIYGSSGGVFESALRTAYFKALGSEMPPDAVRELRGQEGVKNTEMRIGDRTVRIRVVSGLRNAKDALEELKADPKAFDALEVMACPGGCVGGGGQPVPSDAETIERRAASLYEIDRGSENRQAHRNPAVMALYENGLSDAAERHRLLHTSYQKSERTPTKKIADSRSS
ncbi:(2Fe-2S)-binding protein [Candidatus Uhrbacteria bacterium]|nr:(2Fe-2S)-binding protein [Candidatus Uhrbacteria bacterium]